MECLGNYFKNGCLGVPSDLKGLIFGLDHRVLCETDALLLYTLPLDDGELSSSIIAQLCENATGRSLPRVDDPTDYGDIEIEEQRAENTALERLLAEIYPTITKVYCTWKQRLKAGADVITSGNHIWDEKETMQFVFKVFYNEIDDGDEFKDAIIAFRNKWKELYENISSH